MKISFSKFHGAGNDFIMIDNRLGMYNLSSEQIAFLCHRRFGVGADGLMLLNSSADFDFEMKYYNADGREGSMCGNGGRCITAFASYLGVSKNSFVFQAIDGQHKADILKRKGQEWQVALQMIDVNTAEKNSNSFFLDTGSPHHVEFVSNLEEVDVLAKGKEIRYSEHYLIGGGTNVNFASIEDDCIKVRTYERGVEDETLACGTGVTAVAMAAAIKQAKQKGNYRLKTRGGDLFVSFIRNEKGFSNVWLKGPATLVFSGEIVI